MGVTCIAGSNLAASKPAELLAAGVAAWASWWRQAAQGPQNRSVTSAPQRGQEKVAVAAGPALVSVTVLRG